VLRRILRRAVYFGRRIDAPQGSLVRMAEAVIEQMTPPYPYLRDQASSIISIVRQEENRFHETLERGLQRLEDVLARLNPGDGEFPGEEAFRLYDTYGVPKELTDEIAAARGFAPDAAGFEAAMERQRELARSSGDFSASRLVERSDFAALGGATEFVGYERLGESSEIVAVGAEGGQASSLETGARGWLVLASTPFYPEGGGQVGDAGTISGPHGVFVVDDTQRREGGVIAHYGYVREGMLRSGERAEALVDPVRRRDTMRNHTGTHMLHAALREVLGSHAHQAGSLVTPDRLRFDFSHGGAMTPEELLAVERRANEVVRENERVRVSATSYDDALRSGALAFFGEKYGDEVRVVTIQAEDRPPYSSELCGGTHVPETGQIGFVRVVSEGGIGSGVRRIEALTGRAAERWVEDQASLLDRVAAQVGASPATLEARLGGLLAELESERRRLAALERERGRAQAEHLLAGAERVDGTSIVVGVAESGSTKDLRELGDLLRTRLGSSAVVLGSVIQERPQFVVQLTADLVGRGLNAGQIVGQIAAATGGKGGGRPDSAQSGGLDPARLNDALQLAKGLLEERLKQQ